MPVSEPSKYTTLWSQSGIRFDIPQAADPVTGKAGFDVGFSSINMTSEAAGGIPPWGQDFNGILYSLTKSAQYTQAGGIHTFDAALAAAVGGYAVNAMIKADSGLIFFINKIPGNASNPNSGGDGWIRVGPDSYGSPMIGVPIPWPVEQMPQDVWPDCGMVFVKTGEAFSTSEFPILAALYPSGVTPPLKGQTIRGWDDGAGVDPGRALLSQQGDAIRNITGGFGFTDDDGTHATTALASGAFSVRAGTTKPSIIGSSGIPAQVPYIVDFDASLQVPTANENRVKSVAFNYIIRAS